MSKLNKVNKNGSLSIILPKSITENLWKEGEEVNVQGIGHDAILIDRQDIQKKEIDEILADIAKVTEGYERLRNNLKENINIMYDDEMSRRSLRQLLLEIIRRI